MLHHVSLGVSDLLRSAAFYDAALAPLGYVRVWEDIRPGEPDQAIGYGIAGAGDKLALKFHPEGQHPPGPGFHLALAAPNRDAVVRFSEAAIEHGGTDNGRPGLRPHYGPNYYATFVVDPDGHHLEAVFNEPVDLAMPPTLQGRRLRLRAASPDDIGDRFLLGNHPEILEMFGVSKSDVQPITMDGAALWVQTLIKHRHAWVIEADGKLLGEIRLDNLDVDDRRASMAVGILDPERLGKGLGSEAILLLLHHAFVELNLHRISIRVLAYNQRAIHAYQKCGFTIEGTEREAAYVDGAWHDDLTMGLLDREFLAQRC